MSELGNKIRALRGECPYDEFAEKIKLSPRVIHKMERGERVRLDTVLRFADALRLKEPEKLDLVVSWTKMQLGPLFTKIRVEPKSPMELRDKPSLPLQIQAAASNLTTKQQEQILQACERPEVLAGIEHLNQLYNSLRKK